MLREQDRHGLDIGMPQTQRTQHCLSRRQFGVLTAGALTGVLGLSAPLLPGHMFNTPARAEAVFARRTTPPEISNPWYYSNANPYYAESWGGYHLAPIFQAMEDVTGEDDAQDQGSFTDGTGDAGGAGSADGSAASGTGGSGPGFVTAPVKKTYVAGNCTWYAWGRACEALGYTVDLPPYTPMGILNAAIARGFKTGSVPMPGALAIRLEDHIAFVEDVFDGVAYVSESAYTEVDYLPTPEGIVFHYGSINDWSAGAQFIYIYLFDAPPELPDNSADNSAGATDGAAAAGPSEQSDPAVLPASGFYDVPGDAWYYQDGYLAYVNNRGIMNGDTDAAGNPTGTFGPERPITRGEIATVLYRMVTGDAQGGWGTESRFWDAGYAFYTGAVNWCYDAGIVTGRTDGLGNATGFFSPYDAVSREEFATLVWRLAGFLGTVDMDADASVFNALADSSSVSSFAVPAMIWCAGKGIINGIDTGWGWSYLAPQQSATRAQAAKILTVFARDVAGI